MGLNLSSLKESSVVGELWGLALSNSPSFITCAQEVVASFLIRSADHYHIPFREYFFLCISWSPKLAVDWLRWDTLQRATHRLELTVSKKWE